VAPKHHFSILYSDIGKQFYARHGWRAMPSTHIDLPPVSPSAAAETRRRLDLPPVTDITAADMPALCATATEWITAELAARSAHDPAKTFVAVRPDAEHMEWHHAREEFQARVLFGTDPRVKGARDPDTGVALIWSRVFLQDDEHGVPKSRIDVLRTVAPPPSPTAAPVVADGEPGAVLPGGVPETPDMTRSLAALILRAQREAHDWSLPAGVQMWDPQPATLAAARFLGAGGADAAIELVHRDVEHIASLRLGGHGSGHDGLGSPDAEWLACERYAWY